MNIKRIDDITNKDLDIYARLSEKQLLHYYEPNGGLFIAETLIVLERALDAGYEPVSLLIEEKQLDSPQIKQLLDRLGDIPVYTADIDVLGNIVGYNLTRGILCAMKRKTLPELGQVLSGARRIVVVDKVMNPTNLGAIFRSAAALNMDGVVLTPECTNPLYRRAIRVSMGTVFQIPWTYITDDYSTWPNPSMDFLRNAGFKTVAMALRKNTVNIDDPVLHSEEKLAILLGSEGYGLDEKTIDACDFTVKIPMSHGVDSLNVAAASAVAFWELSK